MLPKRENKSDFIRSLATLPAAQVVEKAKAAGMVIAPGLVYAVRAAARKKTRTLAGTVTSRRGSAGTAAPVREAQEFVNLVASMGLIRIEQLLSEFKVRLTSM
jgi:hypothetical protein